ncbi:MAG: phosphodiester glycosidase family protein [Sarcina sp.]|nr:phosphodiester glycosidase family protein [Sarcina sp.]
MKKNTWAVVFSFCLIAFTVFIALDTFVLSSVYQADATQINTEMIIAAKENGESTQKESESPQTDDTDDSGKNGDGNPAGGGASQSDAGDSSIRQEPDQSGSPSQSDAGDNSIRQKPAQSNSPSQSDAGDSESGEEKGSRTGGGPGSSRHGKKPGNKPGHGDSTATTKTISGFDEEEAAESAAEVTTDNSGDSREYKDENVQVTYTQYETNGTTIHVADVRVSSAEYLKTAFAKGTYGKNVTQSTSEIAASNNAVLAVNGDYYGVQERGYVIRNGVLYREEAGENDVLCIYADGSMKVVDPSTATAQELLEQGVWQAFSFGPGLITDGEIDVALNTEVGKAKASNPRTAIGIIDDLHYVFVVSDGRSGESEGLSLYELASFMEQLGVQTAYNLDGGGSSTMVFQGEVVNNPSSGFRDEEREVSDIVYIG